MYTYIALLRGINVSGKNKILIADLKLLFKDLGFEGIQTYIQSGNVMFKTTKKNKITLATLISNKITEVFAYHIAVVVKNKQELIEIVANNPFLNKDIDTKKLYVAYLQTIPKDTQKLDDFNFGNDTYQLVKDVIYLKYETGAGTTKLTNSIIEKKLDVIATSRNWRTTCKLVEMLSN